MTVIVTKLRRNEDGELVARVSRGDGVTVPVAYRNGIWETDEQHPRFVRTDVSIELQARARAFLRQEADQLVEAS